MIQNNDILISIIIPCHNVLFYIDKALDSCLNQTYKNIEIILVENGSTDDSWAYCQELVKKHKGIIFAYQSDPSLFSGGARNIGIEKARGDYLAFLDDDDIFYPKALESLLNYCLEHDLEVAIGSIDRIVPPLESWVLKEKQSGLFLNDDRFDLTLAATSAKLYKTSFIKEYNIRFDITRLIQDAMFYVFSKLLAKRIGVLSFLLEPVFAYQIHPDSSTLQAANEHYTSVVDFAMNLIIEFDRRVSINEQKKCILGDFYGTDLEQAVLAKACYMVTSFLPEFMNYYGKKLSKHGKDNIDKYLKENDIFSRITYFEKKYKAKETEKLYYHQRIKLISIIIPCHNILNYIDKALDSCFNQTYKNIEIILVENGSTDDSWAYCQELVRKHEGIIFAYQSDHSLFSGGARNLGIEKAKGDYLAFLDDDDIFYPKALESLLNYCLEYDLEVAVGSIDRIESSQKSWILKDKQSGIFLNDSRFDLVLTATSAKLYRTSFIRNFDIKFDTTRITQDNMFYVFSRLLAKKIGVLSFLLEPIFAYQIHPDSSTIQVVDQHYKSIVDFAMNIINEFEKRINIDEQRKRILGDFYGKNSNKDVLAKACYAVSKFLDMMMGYYSNKLSQRGRDEVDKYLKENNIFAKITNFERKYGSSESLKLYYHQRLKKHGLIRKIILKILRFIVNFSKKLDAKIANF